MNHYKFKTKPVGYVIVGMYFLLAPLAHYDLPFPLSAATEVLLIPVLGGLLYLTHRKEFEESRRSVDRGLLSPESRGLPRQEADGAGKVGSAVSQDRDKEEAG